MGNIVKKGPKDGVEHDVGFTGNCESCFGPLQFYCKVHKLWLDSEVCNKCAKPLPKTSAREPAAGRDKSDVAVVLGVLVLIVGVIVVIYAKAGHGRRPPPAPSVSTVAHVPAPSAQLTTPPAAKEPAPNAPSFPTYPPIELTIADILVDPDRYLNKLVTTSGQIQLKEPDKESFDLRQGDHSIQVVYRYVGPGAKSQVAGDTGTRTMTATGVLQLDQRDNSYYIVAQDLQLR